MTLRQGFVLVTGSALLVLAMASPATAQTFGVGGGISRDPNQVFVQGLFDQRGLGTTGRIGWRPNVHLGFLDDLTTLTGNVELVVWIPLPNPQWSTYVGGGPSLNILFRGDDDGDGEDDSDVAGGASIVAGVEHERGFFAEIRYGGGEAAGLKLSAGILLRR